MMSRAGDILKRVDEIVPLIPAIGLGTGLATTAANIAYQSAAARKRREEKVKQAGLGKELSRAKTGVSAARSASVRQLGLSKQARQAVRTAKEKRQDVINRGLHKQATMLSKTPAEQQHKLM
jgi:hypothetical protein